jgi:hypothetical protein
MRLFSAISLISLTLLSASPSLYPREVTLPNSFLESGLPLRQEAREKIIGNFVITRKTLSKETLGELIQSAAPVSREAPRKYPNFASYWRMANGNGQRTGKAFEAVLAWRANRVLSNGESMLVTAVEGFPTDPIDLVKVSAKGEVSQRYQAKLRLSLNTASKHLGDSRYTGKTLVTTRESMERILRDLKLETEKAARRGTTLAPKYQRVADALQNGHIAKTWFGRDLPALKGLDQFAKKETRKLFDEHGYQIASASGRKGGVSAAAKNLAGHAFAVLDLGGVVYDFYRDARRYSRGEIGGDYLAVKGTIRTGHASIVVALLLNPEPFVTKATSVVLIVADAGYEMYYNGYVQRVRQEATRRMLEAIDRDQRVYNAQRELLQILHDVV